MHELGVTFHIIDHLEKVAKENEVEKIRKVVLELGEVSTVIESYLQNCWTWAAKKRPLFEEAELIVETLPAITYCEECEKTYSTIEYGKICPHCGSEHTYLLQGSEFNIPVPSTYRASCTFSSLAITCQSFFTFSNTSSASVVCTSN